LVRVGQRTSSVTHHRTTLLGPNRPLLARGSQARATCATSRPRQHQYTLGGAPLCSRGPRRLPWAAERAAARTAALGRPHRRAKRPPTTADDRRPVRAGTCRGDRGGPSRNASVPQRVETHPSHNAKKWRAPTRPSTTYPGSAMVRRDTSVSVVCHATLVACRRPPAASRHHRELYLPASALSRH